MNSIKTVASRTTRKLLGNYLKSIQTVASRATWKLLGSYLNSIKTLASRTTRKLLGKYLKSIQTVASRTTWKLLGTYLNSIKTVAARATWKLLEKVRSIASRDIKSAPPHTTRPTTTQTLKKQSFASTIFGRLKQPSYKHRLRLRSREPLRPRLSLRLFLVQRSFMQNRIVSGHCAVLFRMYNSIDLHLDLHMILKTI